MVLVQRMLHNWFGYQTSRVRYCSLRFCSKLSDLVILFGGFRRDGSHDGIRQKHMAGNIYCYNPSLAPGMRVWQFKKEVWLPRMGQGLCLVAGAPSRGKSCVIYNGVVVLNPNTGRRVSWGIAHIFGLTIYGKMFRPDRMSDADDLRQPDTVLDKQIRFDSDAVLSQRAEYVSPEDLPKNTSPV